jgi:hypothetical protein
MSTIETKMRESELLDKLICDYGPTKYLDIVWAMEWARNLRTREDCRQLPMAEMIEKAMLEIVSGQVTSEQVLAASCGTAFPAKAEEKKEDARTEDKKEKAKPEAKKETKKTAVKASDKDEEEPKKAKKEKAKKD